MNVKNIADTHLWSHEESNRIGRFEMTLLAFKVINKGLAGNNKMVLPNSDESCVIHKEARFLRSTLCDVRKTHRLNFHLRIAVES